jgi:beta propeller repeat protein
VIRAALLALALVTFQASAAFATAIQVTETLLTTNAASETDPRISGDHVVFTGRPEGNADIFRIDLTTFVTTRLEGGPGEQTDADIDGTRVVLTDSSLGNDNIVLVDFNSGDRFLLTTNASSERQSAISGDQVAFVSTAGGTQDVFLFDLNTFTTSLVAGGPGFEIAPAVGGNLIAWQVFESGSINIYAQEIGNPTFAVATALADESGASVSGDLIAYITDGDVAVYDHSTGQTTQITNDAFNQSQVVIDGQQLVWTDDRNGNDDLFLYDMILGETFRLTSDTSDQNLGDFEGNRVVFDDGRLGDFNVWQVVFELPEPSALLLMATGVAALTWRARRNAL